MTEDYIDHLLADIRYSEVFADMKVVRANSFNELQIPCEKPVVSLAYEISDGWEYLIGADDTVMGQPKLTVTVITDERSGSAYCEQTARCVCMELLRLDKRGDYTSVAVERCRYDRNTFAYRSVITFGLRECINSRKSS